MVWAIGIVSPTSSAAVSEQNDVAFLNNVLLAFQAHLRLLARRRKASRSQEIFAPNHFGANEASLDVGVDRTGGFLCAHAAFDRPGADLVLSRGTKPRQ